MIEEVAELAPLCKAVRETAGDEAVVVFFGSRLWEEHDEWSDWDVVVISKQPLTIAQRKSLRRTVTVDLDPSYFTHSEFETYLHAWLEDQQHNNSRSIEQGGPQSTIVAGSIDGDCLLGDERFQRYRELRNSWIEKKLIPDPVWSRLVAIEDGLTETQRIILSALPSHRAQYVKSARVVGDAMDRGAIGDAIIYRSLLSLARPWTTRYPLVDFQGNYGSQDGHSAAGMRYTECRSSRHLQWGRKSHDLVSPETLRAAAEAILQLSTSEDVSRKNVQRVLADAIGKEEKDDAILFPHLVANGVLGHLRVDSSIPSFRLGGVVDALKLTVDEPQADDQALLDALGLPDFATGGMVCNIDEARASLESGVGSIRVAGVCEADEPGREVRIAHQPYGVTGCEDALQESVSRKDLVGVTHVESRLDTNRPQIFLKLDDNAKAGDVVQQVNELPFMTTEVPVNITVLREGKPVQLSMAQLVRYTAEQSLQRHDGSTASLHTEWDSLRELASRSS